MIFSLELSGVQCNRILMVRKYILFADRYRSDGMRLCSKCEGFYDPSFFNKDLRAQDNLKSQCKNCDRKLNKKTYLKMTSEQRAAKYEANRRYRKNNIVGASIIHMLNGVKQRCRKTGKEYEIDRPYIEQKVKIGRCEATGIRFIYERNGRGSITPFSPSLDCINPNKGYTLTNTQMVCSMYNIGKARHDETDFIAMCMAVAERNKDNTKAILRMKELLK